ncbi:MAG: hypothetical protein A2Y62_14440 [Candidatus Fischerbacteria bacterium RBG_13_37_8]|uniref:Beta-ketoacyl-ACP reductase n=1 Tax=Candidatus Fischerbacteria bacterium RBG_13_37_8 TaxID=1817863 RepID=A0A1F5VNZ7_9BACT|nr:MAG: hypothetical protein A2Y62_14440 [Candidatus Fischerbacteria bacterium RBG_13_37_8]
MLLRYKKVLITGGTGAIGEELCRVFAREGADVAFSYQENKQKADKVLSMIRRKKRRGIDVRCSITDAVQVHNMIFAVMNAFGRIDILVNNAGITQVLPFPFIEEEDWDMMMSVNVKGTFLVTKEVVRQMIAQRSGVILNIGSIAGVRMLEVPVHYATSKAAIGGFTLALARELARYHIRVNAIIPGMLESGISTHVPENKYKEYVKYCAAARAGKPEEVAEFAAFLCSDRASYINAQNMLIDGGL